MTTMMEHPRSVKSLKNSWDGNKRSSEWDSLALPRRRERLKRQCKERIQEKRFALFQHIRSKSATPKELVQQICQQTRQATTDANDDEEGDQDLESNQPTYTSSSLYGTTQDDPGVQHDAELLKELEDYLYECMHSIEENELERYECALDRTAAEIAEIEENDETARELAFLNDVGSSSPSATNSNEVSTASNSNAIKQSEVLCPLCKKRWLYQRGAIIICRCGFSLDTLNGITVEHLHSQLAESYQEHMDSGCPGDLEYKVVCTSGNKNDARTNYEGQNLIASCGRCDFMSVVI